MIDAWYKEFNLETQCFCCLLEDILLSFREHYTTTYMEDGNDIKINIVFKKVVIMGKGLYTIQFTVMQKRQNFHPTSAVSYHHCSFCHWDSNANQ